MQPARLSATFRPRARNETVREIGVDGQCFLDVQLLHDHETEAIREAIRLVPVSFEIIERRTLLIRCGPVNARELLAVQLVADPYRLFVSDFACECNRFSDYVIRRQERVGEPNIFEGSEHLDDPLVVFIPRRDEGEEKSGVEECHSRGRPYRY